MKIRIPASADEIVDELPASGIRQVRLILQARGAEVVTQSRVFEVNDSSITINGVDQQSADCVIWSTGASAPPELSGLGLPVDSRAFG